MGYDENIEMVRLAFYQVLMSSGPFLVAALVIGLTIGIIQAATSIQEMTLSFIPKLGAVAAVIFLVGPWMLRLLITFTQRLFLEIPGLVG